MADDTAIQWTAFPGMRGSTWNPTAGCAIKSPGCINCYAMTDAHRRAAQGLAKYAGLTQMTKAGPVWTGEGRLWEPALDEPLRVTAPRMYFVDSMSDLFFEGFSVHDIDRVHVRIFLAQARGHAFQILTKRADRMAAYYNDPETPHRIAIEMARFLSVRSGATRAPDVKSVPQHLRPAFPWWNLWLGISAEDQPRFDERAGDLYACRDAAPVLFVSYEPAIAPLTITTGIDWLIAGGESKLPRAEARICHAEWIESIIGQCRSLGIPCFVKQLGSWPHQGGERIALSHPKGGNPDEWPEGLRVREWPRWTNKVLAVRKQQQELRL